MAIPYASMTRFALFAGWEDSFGTLGRPVPMAFQIDEGVVLFGSYLSVATGSETST
jgi:hypothetical protein